jgi:hypothetical protein
MTADRRARHRLLRTFTIGLAGASVVVGGALYLQVSSALGAFSAAPQAQAGNTPAQPGDVSGLQPAPTDPTAGYGQPVARTGGS